MRGIVGGVVASELPAPVGAAMLGYGARVGAATGSHDPLRIRALHLCDENGELLLIECDLCLIAPAQADEVRDRIASRTGMRPAQILVGCIHTHSGPDTGIGAVLTGQPLAAHVPPIFDAMVDAAVAAHAAREPLRIGVGHARARIGRNRRVDGGVCDDDVLVLRIDGADAVPRAVLYVYGCHPTALGHENLLYSADWPGAAGRVIEDALPGAVAFFAPGSHADVDPRTRDLLDLGVPNQSVGVSPQTMQALGREVGQAVADVARAIGPTAAGPIGALATRVALPVHPGPTEEAERARALADRRIAALAALGVPDDPELGTQDFYRLERECTEGLAVAERRRRVAKVRHYLRDRTAPRFAGGVCPGVEVQLLRLGPVWLLGLPLEATTDVGLDWKRRMAARGHPDASIVSIANGWMRYLPHPRNFEEPDADEKYEIVQSTFVPDAATQLLDAGERLVERLSEAQVLPGAGDPDAAAAVSS